LVGILSAGVLGFCPLGHKLLTLLVLLLTLPAHDKCDTALVQ